MSTPDRIEYATIECEVVATTNDAVLLRNVAKDEEHWLPLVALAMKSEREVKAAIPRVDPVQVSLAVWKADELGWA